MSAAAATGSSFQSVGTWKRYKLGQARFTDWLKQTANKFTPTPVPDSPPLQPASNGTSSGKMGPSLDSASGKVHWSELEDLAQLIVSNSKPEEIPWDPILVLRDVVALRKKSARFYSKTAQQDKTGKLRVSNQQHEHIIKVLEKVLGLLETAVSPMRPKQKKEEPPRPRERLDMGLLDNMFNLLQFQKPAKPPKEAQAVAAVVELEPEAEQSESDSESETEIAATSKTVSRKKTKQTPKKKGKGGKKGGKKAPKSKAVVKKAKPAGDGAWVDGFTLDEQYDDEEEFDYYMLIYCFFEDFNTIRNHVCERWCDYYYDKSVSLNTLAVITNAASELFRDMEFELLRLLRLNGHADLGTYEAMMELLFFEYGMEPVDYNDEPESKEEMNEKIWREEADWLGWSAYVAMEDIFEHCPRGKVPLIPPSARRLPKYGPITAADFASFHKACIMQLFPEVAEVRALKKNRQEPPVIPGQPDLELDFEQVLGLRYYPSSFIFSLQLYLDIRNILDEQVEDACEQLHANAEDILHCTDVAERSCEEVYQSDWRKFAERDAMILSSYAMLDFTIEDKEARARQMGMMEDLPEYALFDTEPVWPALLDFRSKLASTVLSIRLLTRTPAPLWSGVLYTIAKRDYADIPAWPEMDRFLSVHGTELLGFPITEDLKVAEILTNYATTMSDGKRYHIWMGLLDKVGRITNFHDRYADSPMHRADMEYIGNVIRDHFGLPHNSKQSPFGLPQQKKETTGKEKTEELVQRLQRVGNMRHVEILEILDQTVETMVHNELSINYYKLDWEVQTFARKLQNIMLEKGLLRKPEGGLETYPGHCSRDDGDKVLGECIKAVILEVADQPFIPPILPKSSHEHGDHGCGCGNEACDEDVGFDGEIDIDDLPSWFEHPALSRR
ncbi:hypothetical protein CkaCkLH20_04223 [Colletotrichum karsti]|uniref:DUF6604 domain-containing protein n=1 Tax=Colletotrichum karsti TaxID=1095194 RepID=A0A9P6IG73_9PEZI|nr:uncharacterized protein CkaCkLH20_04223 [Colletotrichum karsti]KAF9878185.1 hypothetical protein CkaCkLH20_04223 [Colletotrichum karsti]